MTVPPAPRDRLDALYRAIQRHRVTQFRESSLSDLFGEVYAEALDRLELFDRLPLVSRIEGKTYFAFTDGRRISRAINAELYAPDVDRWRLLVERLHNADSPGPPGELNSAIYSLAVGFCAVIDLTRSRDQRTPGAFFEYLIGHLFSLRVGVTPTRSLRVLNLDMEAALPTDFIFDTGAEKPKFHLPVKTSTRERVIQVWAHQRVLDGVYGSGRFMGTPVILAETKTDAARHEVIEICLPAQWRIYQMHIAQLTRVYYLDVPVAYARLNEVFPRIQVKPFGQFFSEYDDLVA